MGSYVCEIQVNSATRQVGSAANEAGCVSLIADSDRGSPTSLIVVYACCAECVTSQRLGQCSMVHRSSKLSESDTVLFHRQQPVYHWQSSIHTEHPYDAEDELLQYASL